jgi:4-amino-4-deoxy-L-arabinose transferase-like glycosyltransferase
VVKSRWYLLSVVIIQLAIGLPYLDRVPRIFVDEAWDSALGWNLAHNGKLAHPFIEGFGGINVYFIQNRVVLPITSALIFKFTECTTFTSRLGSVLFGTLAVCSLFILTSRWFGNKQAFCVCLATIINPWFFEVSRRARPEIHYTAMGIVLLLALAYYFESGSRLTAFLSGVACGVLVLTHPNGIIISFCVGICSLLWLRGKPITRLLLWGFTGFIIILLPYLIYLTYALQHPGVSFTAQMQKSYWGRSLITKELSRWKNFFVFPWLLPLGAIMYISFFAAWTESSRQVKLLAGITVMYCVILPLASVHQTPRYLAPIVPLSAALIVRFIWRVADWDSGPGRRLRPGIAIAACIAVVYTGISAALVGHTLFSLRNARLDKVADKIAAVIRPGAKVYADPIFWFARDKLNYGPYLISFERIAFRDYLQWYCSNRFEYAVRTSWYVGLPDWAQKPNERMPGLSETRFSDIVCRLFGTKIHEFYDPYYGPIEIYSLDWSKPYY